MDTQFLESTKAFIDLLGLDEEPLGVFFSDDKPDPGFGLKPSDMPTREKEEKNEVDWHSVFSSFGCIMGNIRRGRRKNIPAYFSKEQFGCAGGAFWLGFLKPQTETIIQYVSTGIPGQMEGEFYCDSPDHLREIFQYVDPPAIEKTYCIFKPLSQFVHQEMPELVVFFTHPEVLSGLHQLATFVSNDPEVVVSPWSASCGSLVGWPRHYLAKGLNKAVLGGWDPSARKYFQKDELSFTVPFNMFEDMVNRREESFLMHETWMSVRERIEKENGNKGEAQ